MNEKSKTRRTSSVGGAGPRSIALVSLWGRGYAQIIDIEAAKREGELVFYSAMRAEDTDQMVKAFTKKYPFIKGTYYRAGGDPPAAKDIDGSEGRQAPIRCRVGLGHSSHHAQRQRLCWRPIDRVHQTAYAKGFYDPEGYWTDTYDLYVTIAYNTKMVPKSAVPKTWEDLLDPRWRDGKICLDLRRHDWFYAMMEVMGPTRARASWSGCAPRSPLFARATVSFNS